MSNSSFLSLPNELIIEIGRALPNPDLSRLLRTNRFINSLLDGLLWDFNRQYKPTNTLNDEDWITGQLAMDATDILVYAAETGNLATARKLFKKHDVDPNDTNTAGNLPLGMAVLNNHKEMVEYLLECGAKVPPRLSDNSPLQCAVRDHKNSILPVLLNRCASEQHIRHACLIAIDYDNCPALRMLLSKLSRDDFVYTEYNLLHEAAPRGRIEAAKLLLELKGTLINDRDAEGRTPLLLAVYCRRNDMIRLLIKNGADLEATPSHRPHETSLRLARQWGWDDIAEILVEAGAKEVEVSDEEVRENILYGR